jgi:hypothetical protein
MDERSLTDAEATATSGVGAAQADRAPAHNAGKSVRFPVR